MSRPVTPTDDLITVLGHVLDVLDGVVSTPRPGLVGTMRQLSEDLTAGKLHLIPSMEIHTAGDWSALYVDGELVPGSVGDSYIATEKAFTVAHVTEVHDDAFMRGGTQRSDVAPDLDAVYRYSSDRAARHEEAATLRAQAEAILARAAELSK